MDMTSVEPNADALKQAAAAIARADFILVAAGAGFSADSGLPVYNDIASVEAYERQGLEYHDLCNPYWLEEDEQVFYGFWGNCLDTYRDTTAHTGYDILRKWKERLQQHRSRFRETFESMKQNQAIPAGVTASSVTNDGFFVYTSNVDAHFLRSFSEQEVYELHGSLENWQCAGAVDWSGRRPCGLTWQLPPSTRFHVDASSMRVDGQAVVGTCPECDGQVRPNVLMFHDKNWIPNTDDEDRYVAWEGVMEQMLQSDPLLKLVVLEIGCGMRVPSVRMETEMVAADVFARCSGESQVTLVRINPDFPGCDDEALVDAGIVLSIRSTALAALTEIDRLLPSM